MRVVLERVETKESVNTKSDSQECIKLAVTCAGPLWKPVRLIYDDGKSVRILGQCSCGHYILDISGTGYIIDGVKVCRKCWTDAAAS